MKKKIKSKLHLADFLVTIFCLSLSAFFAYMFYRDLTSFTLRSDKKPIGHIYDSSRVIQRKFDDRVVWERVSQNAELYNNDTIRTSDLSYSVIKFKDNTVLNLYENTMIQVSWSESAGLKIKVDDGGIMLDSTEAKNEAKVQFDDGSVVQIDAGSSLAAQADAEKSSTNIEIKSGTAQITTETGDAMDLVVGESVNVGKTGRILKNPLTVVYPPKELRLLNTDDNDFTNVEFEWKNEYETPVIVQTSRLKNFSTLESDDIVQYASTYTMEVPNGTIYWRVLTMYTIDSPVTGKIVIDNDTQMDVLAPAREASFLYYKELPRIKFRWSGNENASHYRLVVSSTRDMKNVVATREVQDAFATLDSLQEGTWFWQVMPYYPFDNIGYTGGSEICSFSVVHADRPKPPELIMPSQDAEFTRKSGEKSVALFSWKNDIQDAKYTLLVSRDEKFSQLVYSDVSDGGRLVCDLDESIFAEGKYFWKIVRLSADEEEEESQPRSFSVYNYVPKVTKLLYPPESFSAENSILASTQFLWKLSDELKNYPCIFQISEKNDFSSVLVEKRLDTSFIGGITLSPGTYWWRVGSFVDGENALAGLTSSRKFVVLGELPVPEIIFPSLGQELVVKKFEPVEISWKAVNGADSYGVRVFDENENVVAKNLSVPDTRASFSLIPGKYTFHVFAKSSATETSAARTSSVSSGNFSVRGPETIVLSMPADKSEIDGLQALRHPLYFSWQTGKDKASEYTFVLQKEQKNGKYEQVESISGSGNSVSLKRVKEGKYRWSVRANMASGLPLDSQEFSFVIKKVPELKKAVLTEPANALVMGADYLRKHRTITFRWQRVKSATAYDFELVKKDSGKVVLSKTNIHEPQVRLSDLTLLDVGEFEWRVRAYCYARDGFEEQRSPLSTASFSIRFDKPNGVRAFEPGKLYGE